MADMPNFEEMALTLGKAIGASRATAVAQIATAVRDMWNARGAADLEQVAQVPQEGQLTHYAYNVRRAIRDLNK